jgi:hypothetical protein
MALKRERHLMHKTVNARFECRIITITSPGFSGRSLRKLIAGGTLRPEPRARDSHRVGASVVVPGQLNGRGGESVVE